MREILFFSAVAPSVQQHTPSWGCDGVKQEHYFPSGGALPDSLQSISASANVVGDLQ